MPRSCLPIPAIARLLADCAQARVAHFVHQRVGAAQLLMPARTEEVASPVGNASRLGVDVGVMPTQAHRQCAYARQLGVVRARKGVRQQRLDFVA